MSIIKKLSEFIVFSNLWVALCASGLTLNTYYILDTIVNFQVVLLVFFSTFSVYNLQRIVKHNYQKKNFTYRHNWLYNHNFIISISSGLASILALITFFNLFDFIIFLCLLPFTLTSILYAFTIFSKKRALRDLPFLKVFLISITWAVSSVILPLLELGLELSYQSIALFIFNFLFIVALTIPFDIRDLKLDDLKTNTIPQVLGVHKAIFVSYFLLVICIGITFYIDQTILIVPLFICLVLISQSKKEMPELFYSGILDGAILMLPLTSLIFN